MHLPESLGGIRYEGTSFCDLFGDAVLGVPLTVAA